VLVSHAPGSAIVSVELDGQVQTVQVTVEGSAPDPNALDALPQRALDSLVVDALLKRDSRTLLRVLAAGGDAEAVAPDGRSGVVIAAGTGRTDLVSALVRCGVERNGREMQRAIAAVRQAGNAKMVEELERLQASGEGRQRCGKR
jgi:hypothetical protein